MPEAEVAAAGPGAPNPALVLGEAEDALAAVGVEVVDAAEQRAQEHERRLHERVGIQFQRLKDDARAVYGMVDGRPGVRSPAEWAKLLDRAGDEIGNGRFIVRWLGAERYLDALTVAALITLRQGLLADIAKPSTADIMMVDTAIAAYYGFLRVQGWIGNLSLVVERELFGSAPLTEIHGETVGTNLRSEIARLAEVMLPLQDRCHRMMIRSLGQLTDRT